MLHVLIAIYLLGAAFAAGVLCGEREAWADMTWFGRIAAVTCWPMIAVLIGLGLLTGWLACEGDR